MSSLLLAGYWHLSQFASHASAQVFNGTGLEGGVAEAGQINGPVNGTLREVILSFLYKALYFLALGAVIMVVAAGFYMVLSGGNEGAKDKAKKIILYVVIGLIIVLIARAIVGFFIYGLP
jgi:hypothetical protein